jgi:hypothetical protein
MPWAKKIKDIGSKERIDSVVYDLAVYKIV